MKLNCYPVDSHPPRIAPARRDRPWMDALPNANRCLPLSIANAYGWDLLAPTAFSVHWNGGPGTEDLRIVGADGAPLTGFAESNFRGGIVTFHAGYIFRTDPGWNLLVTGPFNQPKDGISPLAGIVETDWLPYPFTMNWQFTRAGVVHFAKDEPFCRIVPVASQALSEIQPEIHPLESDQELADQFRQWRERRDLFRVNVRSGDQPTIREAWQKFYFKAELPNGQAAAAPSHVQKLRLAEPIDLRPAAVAGPTKAEVEVSTLPRTEGFVPVTGGRVWYRSIGHAGGIPLLVLNGGPGLSHDYLEDLAALGDERPVIFYDQLGCGRSERPADAGLWNFKHLAEDLRQVRQALGLERVHLFGHSTGATLAVEHALAEAKGIESLVLASPCLDMPRWMADGRALREQLPADFQMIYSRAQSEGVLNSANNQAAVRTYYRRHLCRLQPWPNSLVRAFAGLGYGVNSTLWGPNPFECSAALRSYAAGDRLAAISTRTLLTCGAHDFATPAATADAQRRIPHAQLVVFPHSSHMPHLEEPEAYLATLRKFLCEGDSRPTNGHSHDVAATLANGSR